jgi:hypothetical protein
MGFEFAFSSTPSSKPPAGNSFDRLEARRLASIPIEAVSGVSHAPQAGYFNQLAVARTIHIFRTLRKYLTSLFH